MTDWSFGVTRQPSRARMLGGRVGRLEGFLAAMFLQELLAQGGHGGTPFLARVSVLWRGIAPQTERPIVVLSCNALFLQAKSRATLTPYGSRRHSGPGTNRARTQGHQPLGGHRRAYPTADCIVQNQDRISPRGHLRHKGTRDLDEHGH